VSGVRLVLNIASFKYFCTTSAVITWHFQFWLRLKNTANRCTHVTEVVSSESSL